MNPQSGEHGSLLRKALVGNALFSTLSGLTILLAQGWVLRILGLSKDVSLAILGFALLVFAATLVVNARRQQVKTSDAWIAVLMDVAWVLGSYVLIFVVPFSTEGKWVVGVVAELVSVFAVLQFVGIRRIQKSERFG
jgi:uncharacterized membrane protein HdeD (DUF308 family)